MGLDKIVRLGDFAVANRIILDVNRINLEPTRIKTQVTTVATTNLSRYLPRTQVRPITSNWSVSTDVDIEEGEEASSIFEKAFHKTKKDAPKAKFEERLYAKTLVVTFSPFELDTNLDDDAKMQLVHIAWLIEKNNVLEAQEAFNVLARENPKILGAFNDHLKRLGVQV